MKLLRRAIPSPGTLLIFEAAARLGSFTRAAEELGMTYRATSAGSARQTWAEPCRFHKIP